MSKLKTFTEFLNEMAYNTGVADNRNKLSAADEWTDYGKDMSLLVNLGKYRIYYNCNEGDIQNEVYFASDAQDNYKGVIRMDEGRIYETHSEMTGGFYAIMLYNILKFTSHRVLFSDERLSSDAISAYNRLSSSSDTLNISVWNHKNKTILPFSKENLLSDNKNVVHITLK